MINRDSWIWIDPERFPDRQTSRYTGVWGNIADNDTVVEFSKSVTVGDGTEKWVELPLDIDAARALNIVKNANNNYRFFNGGSREDKLTTL